jgi:hypothetical protein
VEDSVSGCAYSDMRTRIIHIGITPGSTRFCAMNLWASLARRQGWDGVLHIQRIGMGAFIWRLGIPLAISLLATIFMMD